MGKSTKKNLRLIMNPLFRLVLAVLIFFVIVRYSSNTLNSWEDTQREALLPASIEERINQYYKDYFGQSDNSFWNFMIFPDEGTPTTSEKKNHGVDKVVCLTVVLHAERQDSAILYWIDGFPEVNYFVSRSEWQAHLCPGD